MKILYSEFRDSFLSFDAAPKAFCLFIFHFCLFVQQSARCSFLFHFSALNFDSCSTDGPKRRAECCRSQSNAIIHQMPPPPPHLRLIIYQAILSSLQLRFFHHHTNNWFVIRRKIFSYQCVLKLETNYDEWVFIIEMISFDWKLQKKVENVWKMWKKFQKFELYLFGPNHKSKHMHNHEGLNEHHLT